MASSDFASILIATDALDLGHRSLGLRTSLQLCGLEENIKGLVQAQKGQANFSTEPW